MIKLTELVYQLRQRSSIQYEAKRRNGIDKYKKLAVSNHFLPCPPTKRTTTRRRSHLQPQRRMNMITTDGRSSIDNSPDYN